MASIYDKASLVLIPSGTKTSKVYSQVPTNGDGDFTFSRSTAATRVNASGNIEKETQNLLLYSSDQSNSAYNISSGISSPVAVSNPLTGTNNAYKIAKVSGHPDPYRGQSVVTSLNGCYTGSVWIWTDAGQPTDCELFLYNGDVSEVYTKPITITTTPTRYEFFVNFNSTAGQLRFRVDLSTATDQYIYVYGYQLERGLVARDYIETTTTAIYGGITDNVPRLDYQGSCPALLLEPQRTNELQHSEYVSTWAQNTADITLSDNLSPEGYKNCWRVEGTASGTQVGVATFNRIQGATYTTSIWIRKVSGSDTAIFRDVNNNSTTIDITTEWQRYTLTSTTTSTTARLYVMVQNVGDVIEVYGAQLEQGSYATSYIPTYGSAVTRNAEGCNKTSATSLIGQTEGTLYVEVDFDDSISDAMFMTISDATSANRLHIGYDNSSDWIYCNVKAANLQQALLTSASPTDGLKKIAVAYKQNDFVMYINGTQVAADTNANVPTTNRIDIGNYWSAGYEHPVKENLLFKTRLSNEELAALTTI